MEKWKDIQGYEGRYQISSIGRIKALSFMQRFTHARTKAEHFRKTKVRDLATQPINSGYLIVHLYLNGKRTALLVHRLVAAAFCENYFKDADVNHKDGNKLNNNATNLEWVTRTDNHLHAVRHRLNKAAVPVIDPATGIKYDSVTQAASKANKSHRKVSATFAPLDVVKELI